MIIKKKKIFHLCISFGASLFLFLVLIIKTDQLVIFFGIIFLIFYNLFVLNLLSNSSRLTFSMHFFLILFATGHIIKTGYIFLNLEEAKSIMNFTVNNFDFSTNSLVKVFISQLLTLFGAFISIKYFSKINFFNYNLDFIEKKKNWYKLFFFLWLIFSFLLILF